MHLQRNQPLLASLLAALMLLQQGDLFSCHHQKRASSATAAGHRMPHPQPRHDPSGDNEKRSNVRFASGGSAGVVGGQPEEIFYAGDQMESNYDEYPMVVPKRGDLLINRLVMALHRALEKERRLSGNLPHDGLSHFRFNDKNRLDAAETAPAAINDEANNNNDAAAPAVVATGGEYGIAQQPFADAGNSMYSDDDPSIMMDYDFKDLNAINRATGETLMGKGFQRRANVGGGGDIAASGIAMLRSVPASVAAAATSGEASAGVHSGGGGGGGGGGHKTPGRLYWRCYFNAVSCF